MRLWHYELLQYLPDLQFRGQLREIIAIMHDWRDNGSTHHILINRVMDYPKEELFAYYDYYSLEYIRRYGKLTNAKYDIEFRKFAPDYNVTNYLEDLELFEYGCSDRPHFIKSIYDKWHNDEYLKVCMANLYEKHFYGKGKYQITQQEWDRLLQGYKEITGKDYEL